jgi:hypothetical protein
VFAEKVVEARAGLLLILLLHVFWESSEGEQENDSSSPARLEQL